MGEDCFDHLFCRLVRISEEGFLPCGVGMTKHTTLADGQVRLTAVVSHWYRQPWGGGRRTPMQGYMGVHLGTENTRHKR